ncbi:MAG: MBL fold metallo-hydrolase [Chloroflexota bacterium]
MKVTLLGTGTPTNPHRFQSGIAVEVGNDLLLFDAGRGTVHQMYQARIPVGRVNPVFITHHHFDHINDLFDVIISSAMQGREEQLQIFGPVGTQKIVRALLEQVYAADIRFRLEEDKGIRLAGGSWGERPEAIADVAVQDVGEGIVTQADGWQVTTAFVTHGIFPHAPDFEWHCLGYRLEAEGKVLTISGDTVPCEGLAQLAQGADLLIQCCHLPQKRVNTPVMRYLTESILPASGQVGTIAAAAKVKKMVLTHLSQAIDATTAADVLADVAQDFTGETVLGEDLMTLDV